jgi:mannitol 2-dehydrogenase
MSKMTSKISLRSLEAIGEQSTKVILPKFKRADVSVGILHYGVGNFHRSHQAMYVNNILASNPSWGICGVNVLDKAMDENMKKQDCLYSLWERSGESLDQSSLKIIGSHLDSIYTKEEFSKLVGYLTDPNLKLVTLTVTEKGYGMDLSSGKIIDSFYANDFSCFKGSPNSLTTAVGQIVYGLQLRRDKGLPPFTVLSCDNVQENGCKTKDVTLKFADMVDPALRSWIEENVAFPNSMVDRITPRATPEDQQAICDRFGVDDLVPVVSEDFTQWVVEDKFVNGRLPVENEENILFVEDVLPYELMKLRLLNSSHQVLAYPAILLGHRLVHKSLLESPEMRDFLHLYMRLIASTIPPVSGVSFDEYMQTLLVRFENANCPDTLLRLSEDSVNRLETAFVPSLPNTKSASDIMALPIACWIQYWIKSQDELGVAFEKTPDDRAQPLLSLFTACSPNPSTSSVSALLAQAYPQTTFDDAFVTCVVDLLSQMNSQGVSATMKAVNAKYANKNF